MAFPNSSRHFSTRETLAYMTGWVIVCAALSLNTANFFTTLTVVSLPGVLIAGPLGLVFGGRRWFWPAAAVGSIIWAMLLLVPVIDAAG